ncbi:hypothetical protein FSP39_017144 [Pinctada imbricata]|uniref:Cytochrome P450 n=1 Tax=Pinctada imbricata TaxID=66713 RepID=A0AA88XG24_PINIB|nr:hypothetical protein FSP39_017144 [Pinctada imbricata]
MGRTTQLQNNTLTEQQVDRTKHWHVISLTDKDKKQKKLPVVSPVFPFAPDRFTLGRFATQDLRKQARQLENEIDLKLVSFSKLGTNYSSHHDFGSESAPLINKSSSEHMFDTMAMEIEQLLTKLHEVNDRMADYTQNVGTNSPSAALLHTLQRHRDILQDYSQEYQKTKSNITSLREREDLLGSVRRDINAYKNSSGLNRRTDLYLKEHEHIRNSDRLLDDQISVAIATKENLQSQKKVLGGIQQRMNNLANRFPIINSLMQRINLRKEDPEQLKKRHLDFLDILLSAKDEDGTGLTDEEIREEVDTFLFAGHDTTASAISWLTYYLGKYPEEQQKVYEEVRNLTKGEDNFTWENINDCRYLALFIKEAMRITPPVPIIVRYLTKPFEFDGVEIPAGTQVGLFIVHINNHPSVWKDHEVFRPERFLTENVNSRDPYAYVPFSAGPRNCIGQRFAMDEVKVIIARLLLR